LRYFIASPPFNLGAIPQIHSEFEGDACCQLLIARLDEDDVINPLQAAAGFKTFERLEPS
jgi:hypothetical protein